MQQLCPVEAYLDWKSAAQIKSGPVFRSINRWGQISYDALHPASIIGIIKQCCTRADIDEANLFSSHSLRRGFATWANAQGWDTKSLMEYVGWKDVQSAMRYIDLIAAQEELLATKQARIDAASTALISQALIEKLSSEALNQ